MKLPIDLIIDLGDNLNLCGFRYYPDQGLWGPGIITHFQFYISANGTEWKMVDEGEFPNIINNPTWQIRNFSPVPARFIKLRAVKNAEGNGNIGYAEFDIITR
jgi:alpha-L-fucosidase